MPIAGVFQNHVLKAAAGAEAWDFVFSGMTNRRQGFVQIPVRAAGRYPDTGVAFEQRMVYVYGRNPVGANSQTRRCPGMFDSGVCRQMQRKCRRVFAKQCN